MEGMDLEQLQFTGHERDEHASGSCSPATQQVDNQTLSNGEHIIACDEISSENTTIAGTGEVTFSTAGEIVLGPGFVVEDTVDWVADIDQELQLERQDLDYMHARYASPWLGRFGSVDPVDSASLEDPQSWNRYAYALNNPIGYVDPDGEAPRWLPYVIDQGFGGMSAEQVASALVDAARRSVSLVISVAPGAGDIQDVITAVTGTEPVSGEQVSGVGRIVAGAAALVPIVGSKAMRQVAAGDVVTLSKRELKRHDIDPHSFKRDLLGEKASVKKYDVGQDKGTGEIVLIEKKTGQIHSTGLRPEESQVPPKRQVREPGDQE